MHKLKSHAVQNESSNGSTAVSVFLHSSTTRMDTPSNIEITMAYGCEYHEKCFATYCATTHSRNRLNSILFGISRGVRR